MSNTLRPSFEEVLTKSEAIRIPVDLSMAKVLCSVKGAVARLLDQAYQGESGSTPTLRRILAEIREYTDPRAIYSSVNRLHDLTHRLEYSEVLLSLDQVTQRACASLHASRTDSRTNQAAGGHTLSFFPEIAAYCVYYLESLVPAEVE